MKEVRVRFAESTDAGEIAALFLGSFPSQVGRLLIYGAKGAPEFIRMRLAAPHSLAASKYFVAECAGAKTGAAELRRQPNALFLNYIAVLPAYRGRGVGAQLLLSALKALGVTSGRIELDVREDNPRAMGWYRRLGFEATEAKDFLDLRPPGGAGEEAYVEDLPQADLCQERFGFSEFRLIARRGVFRAGRIGDEWFRLTDPAAVASPSVFTALERLDPRRRIFAVVPGGSVAEAQVVRVLAKSRRMEAEIAGLLTSLSHDCQKSGIV